MTKHGRNILLLLCFAFMWEMIEHYLETSSIEVISWAFWWVEFWGNRIITDNICILLGYFLMTQKRTRLFTFLFWWLWVASFVVFYPDIFHVHSYIDFQNEPFWWDKTVSWFDPWSIEHLVLGVYLGTFLLVVMPHFIKDAPRLGE